MAYLHEFLVVSGKVGKLVDYQEPMYAWGSYKIQGCHGMASKEIPKVNSELEKLPAERKAQLLKSMDQLEKEEISYTEYMRIVLNKNEL